PPAARAWDTRRCRASRAGSRSTRLRSRSIGSRSVRPSPAAAGRPRRSIRSLARRRWICRTDRMTILAVAGSTRAGSFNQMLLRPAIGLAPAGTTVESASIAGIPLYDGDSEAASGVPPAVVALKERIARADGVLLVTPEYNNSLPGPFKNAIDWTS